MWVQGDRVQRDAAFEPSVHPQRFHDEIRARGGGLEGLDERAHSGGRQREKPDMRPNVDEGRVAVGAEDREHRVDERFLPRPRLANGTAYVDIARVGVQAHAQRHVRRARPAPVAALAYGAWTY